jgi:tRNA modification GTPase
LIGEPNAGKSSLFNALTGLPSSIVSPMPGTTRDYVTRTMNLGEVKIELIDTAGWQQAGDTIEEQAQALGGQQTQMADLLLWCCDATLPAPEPRRDLAGLDVILVVTKADLARSGEGKMATSAKTRMGIDQLEKLLIERAKSFSNSAMASSLSRCRHHVDSCLKHLRAAHAIVLFDHPAELLALELRLALEQLGEMVGAVYTDDLLDRIFSRFCIGK